METSPLHSVPLSPSWDTTSSRRHLALVYNPNANYWLKYGIPSERERVLRSWLDPLGLTYTLLPFDNLNRAGIPAQIQSLNTTEIWVAGGDGSVLALAPVAKQLGLPLGVLPAGTMNLLARDLGISLDLSAAAQQLADAEVFMMDAAEVNGELFLCISNLGLSTRYTQLREDLRHHSPWVRWSYVSWQMLRALFYYPVLHLRIVGNGQNWQVKTRALSISNNPLSNNGSFLPGREALDTGQLGVYITQETSLWSLPRLIARLLLGNWQHDANLLKFQSQDVTIHFVRRRKRRVKLMSDGEILAQPSPLHYRSHARYLAMLRPVHTSAAESSPMGGLT